MGVQATISIPFSHRSIAAACGTITAPQTGSLDVSLPTAYPFVLGSTGYDPGTNTRFCNESYHWDVTVWGIAWEVGLEIDLILSNHSSIGHSCLRRLVEFQVTITKNELVMKFGTSETGKDPLPQSGTSTEP